MIRKSFEQRPLLALVAAVAVASLLALPLMAQPRGGPGPGPGDCTGPGFGPGQHFAGGGPGYHDGSFAGRGFERMARYLELTDEQRTQAQAIHEAAREQVQPIMEQNRTLHGELRDLLAEPAPDATAVGEKMLAIHANREQVRQIHTDVRAQFQALLTPEQLDKLADLEERRQDRQDRRGRRGGRGPGPGAF